MTCIYIDSYYVNKQRVPKMRKGNNERNVGSRPELRDALDSYIVFVYKTAFWSYLLYFGRQF